MTKLIKKGLFSIGLLSAIAVPTLAAAACGSSSEDVSKIVTIQVEKDSIAFVQKAINALKSSNADTLKQNDIADIRVNLIPSSFDTEGYVNTKGFRDEALADIFLVPADKFAFYSDKSSLKAFTETTVEDFAKNNIGANEQFEVNAVSLSKNNQIFGVSQNIEAMVSFVDSAVPQLSAQQNLITNFSDLWKSAGFFNNSTKNLKDIVKRNSVNGKIERDTALFSSTDIENGFTNILAKISGSGLENITDFDSDAGKAAPEVNKAWAASQATPATARGLIDGPWNLNTLVSANGNKNVVAYAPANYNQWRGGWSYVINARVTASEQKISEMLIGELLKPAYAVQAYKDAGKLSSIVSGRQAIKNALSTELTVAAKSIAEAIYETPRQDRPVKSEFGIIWTAYSSTISEAKNKLVNVAKRLTTDIITAAELTTSFEQKVAAAITKENSSL